MDANAKRRVASTDSSSDPWTAEFAASTAERIRSSFGGRLAESVGRDRREFTRVPFEMDVDVELESRDRIAARSKDVSLKGLFLQCEPQPTVGVTCAATLHFAGRDVDLRIETVGRVVRADEGGIGIEFSAVNSGGLDHLKNLVLYNSNEPDAVMREFNTHVGIRPRDWPFCG